MTITEDRLVLEITCKCGAVLRVESDIDKHRERCKKDFQERHKQCEPSS